MNPETFFDKFGLLADTPNGVQKLRELILQLAVQGKLVAQDSNDEPAAVQIQRIKKEKLVSEAKSILPINAEDLPFELPQSWEWVSFRNIVEFNIGRTPKTSASEYWSNNGIPWVSIADMQHHGTISTTKKTVSQRAATDVFKVSPVPAGTILMSFKLTIGKISILGIDAYHNEAIISIHPAFPESKDFIYRILPQVALGGKINDAIKGKTLNSGSLTNLLIPFPPLAEQLRIVAKVDQLMTLCDEFEARQQKKQEARLRLNSAALDKLLTAHEPAEFANHWQRVCDNFDLLYDNPETVGELRKAILQLAVQGKLVRQDENDEPAAVLLEKIKAEKERFVKEKRIKIINTLPLIKSKEESFKLPDGWEFVRLGEIVLKLGAGSTPKGGKEIYQNKGIKFLRSQNVWNRGLFLQNVAYISSEIHQRMNGTLVKPGDILLNITGASIGRCAIVPDDFDEGNVNQHVTIVRLIDKTLRYYMHICLISPLIQDTIMDVQVGISREGLSISQLKEFLIPLPPYEEQHRIVAKVDQLMALCDELEAKLRQSQTDGGILMEAVVAGLVGA